MFVSTNFTDRFSSVCLDIEPEKNVDASTENIAYSKMLRISFIWHIRFNKNDNDNHKSYENRKKQHQQQRQPTNEKQLECSELELRMVLEIGFFMQMHQFKICSIISR